MPTPEEIIAEMEKFHLKLPDNLSIGAQWALDHMIDHMRDWLTARASEEAYERMKVARQRALESVDVFDGVTWSTPSVIKEVNRIVVSQCPLSIGHHFSHQVLPDGQMIRTCPCGHQEVILDRQQTPVPPKSNKQTT